MKRQPIFYRLLYSPGTAALMILASGALLAVANGRAVFDFFRGIHPDWEFPFLFANAAGTEIGIIAIGLVYAAGGNRKLLYGETVLVAASAWISYLVAVGAENPWSWQAAQVGLPAASVPVLYLITVLAGHHLAQDGARAAEAGAPAPERGRATKDTGPAPRPPEAPLARPNPAASAPAAAPSPTMFAKDPEVTAAQRRNAERYAVLAAEVGDDTVVIAKELGVSPRTVRNYRGVARMLGMVAA